MNQIIKTIMPFLIVAILSILLFRQCSKQKETVTTTIDYEKVIDSLKRNIKIPEPIKEIIYLDSVVYLKSTPIILKGKDSIIYKTDTLKVPVIANRYDTKLKSNNAVANLSIYTSGTLFDVQGLILYDKEIKTVERIKKVHKNTTYLYLETSILPLWNRAEIGVDRTIGKKIIIGGSIEHIPDYKQTYFNAKIGYAIN
jgi:hypothetical protein